MRNENQSGISWGSAEKLRYIVNKDVRVWVATIDMLKAPSIFQGAPTLLDAVMTDASDEQFSLLASEPLLPGDRIWIQATDSAHRFPEYISIAPAGNSPLHSMCHTVIACRRLENELLSITVSNAKQNGDISWPRGVNTVEQI